MLYREITFHFGSNDNVDQFNADLGQVPGVQGLRTETDGKMKKVIVNVQGPTEGGLDYNIQYVLGYGHALSKLRTPTKLEEEIEVLKTMARRFSSLRADVTFDDETHIEYGMGKLLSKLWDDSINPLEVVAIAMEDANHHEVAEACRKLKDK